MKKQAKNDTTKSEAKIQQEIVQWYRNTYCLKHYNPRCMIFSIPNEGRAAASAQLIATGLYGGCADLMVFHVKRPITIGYEETQPLFFEIKTPTGIQSTKQKHFEVHACDICVPYHIVRSLDEFKQVIENL